MPRPKWILELGRFFIGPEPEPTPEPPPEPSDAERFALLKARVYASLSGSATIEVLAALTDIIGDTIVGQITSLDNIQDKAPTIDELRRGMVPEDFCYLMNAALDAEFKRVLELHRKSAQAKA